jgi:hypothetical protein
MSAITMPMIDTIAPLKVCVVRCCSALLNADNERIGLKPTGGILFEKCLLLDQDLVLNLELVRGLQLVKCFRRWTSW